MSELRLRHEGVAWKEVDGEIVALDERAASIWRGQPGRRAAVAHARARGGDARGSSWPSCMGDTGSTATATAADTDAFLRDLSERGLLDG